MGLLLDRGVPPVRKLFGMRWGGRSVGRRIGAAALLTLGLGGVLGVASVTPAHAQESLIDSDPAVVRARAEVEAAQQAAHEAEAKLEETTQHKADVEASIVDHQQHIAALDQQRAELAQERDTLLDHLRQRAVALYSMGGDGTSAADIFSGSVLEGARRKQLGDAASRSDHDNAKQLEETRKTLADTQTSLRKEQSDLEDQQSELEGLVATLQSQQAAVDARVAEANAALERRGPSARCTRRVTR